MLRILSPVDDDDWSKCFKNAAATAFIFVSFRGSVNFVADKKPFYNVSFPDPILSLRFPHNPDIFIKVIKTKEIM